MRDFMIFVWQNFEKFFQKSNEKSNASLEKNSNTITFFKVKLHSKNYKRPIVFVIIVSKKIKDEIRYLLSASKVQLDTLPNLIKKVSTYPVQFAL